MTIEQLTNLHNLIMQFERGQIKTADYINAFNKAGGFNHSACNTCTAFNAKLHSDFQIWFWNQVKTYAPSYLVKVPTFITNNLNTPYYHNQIPLWSFKIIDAQIERLKREAAQNFRDRSKTADLYKDIESLENLKLAKTSFVENEDSVDKRDIIKFHNAGWSVSQISERLKLSGTTIRKYISAGPEPADEGKKAPKKRNSKSTSESSEKPQ